MLVNKSLYDALKSANVSDELASKAAEFDQESKNSLIEIKARLSMIEKAVWAILLAVVAFEVKAWFG